MSIGLDSSILPEEMSVLSKGFVPENTQKNKLLIQVSSKTVHADLKQHSSKHGGSCTPPRKRVKRAKLYHETTPSDEQFEESDTSTSSEW